MTLAPKSAFRDERGTTFAFVVGANDVVEKRAVRLGGSDGDRVEVVAGLRPGDRVVVSPPADLADGAKVKVK